MEVEGGHWATHSCPGLAAKGHKPLGMSDPPTWGGVGQPTWLGACSWTGMNQGYFWCKDSFTPKSIPWVLILVSLGGGGEPSPCPPLVPVSLPRELWEARPQS